MTSPRPFVTASASSGLLRERRLTLAGSLLRERRLTLAGSLLRERVLTLNTRQTPSFAFTSAIDGLVAVVPSA